MSGISSFRLGNYAMFDGLLQKIETLTGLSHSRFLDPIPVSISSFKCIGFTEHAKPGQSIRYFFETVEGDGISVTFSNENTFIITEKVSGIEFPFLQWVHEIQNLVEDRIAGRDQLPFKGKRRTIAVK